MDKPDSNVVWTVRSILKWTTDYFTKRGIASPRLDGEVLLADTLGLSRVDLFIRFDQPLVGSELIEFRARVARRGAREPVAYITGRKEFWALEFFVGSGVLIPRPDTERLVEEAIKLLGRRPRAPKLRQALPWNEALANNPAENKLGEDPSADEPPGENASIGGAPDEDTSDGDVSPPQLEAETSPPELVLDLCTGCGIIPTVLALETRARVIGVDISAEALAYARKNVSRHGCEARTALLQGHLTQPVPKRFHGRFTLLTANPPYVSTPAFDVLEPEISQHEPQKALLAGRDGLDIIRGIIPEINRMLKPGGWTLLEIGAASQAEHVSRLLKNHGMTAIRVLQDLSRNPRVVVAQRPE